MTINDKEYDVHSANKRLFEYFGYGLDNLVFSLTFKNGLLTVIRYSENWKMYADVKEFKTEDVVDLLGIPIVKISDCGKYRMGMIDICIHCEAGKWPTVSYNYEITGMVE